ncbi:MAG: DUF3558 family protein [Hyphomonas sp.]
MKALPYLPALLLLTIAACSAAEDTPAGPAGAASTETPEAPAASHSSSGFDWNIWAALVNSEPCDWLPDDFLVSIGIAGSGEGERSSTGLRCIWRNDDGTPAFSAGIQFFDSAVNLAGDRREAVRLVDEMPAFSLIGDASGSVTSIYRSDRGQLSMYPNSDDENVLIVINAHHTMQDTPEQKQEKSGRARAYVLELIAAYSL